MTRRRTRVLILIKGLGLGGAETLLVNALPYFDRERFEYEVGYLLPWKTALVEPLRNAGIPVTCFDMPRASSLGGLWRLRRHLQRRRIEILHAHLPIPGVLGRLAAVWPGGPRIVYTEHNVWQRLHPLSRLLNRWTFRLNDRSIAVSDEVRQSMRTAPGAVVTIENGIDCAALENIPDRRHELRAELGFAPDDVVITKVANLTPKKNHELLLQAFARVAEQAPAARLLLVGQFVGRDEVLRGQARDLGIGDRVRFTGPREDILQLLNASDLYAMSSRFEGLPISLLEAMGMGLPAVCTAVGGIPDVIQEGACGCLVPSGDAAALADRLLRLVGDEPLRRRMGAAAARRVREQFDISRMVRRVEAVYAQALAGRERAAAVSSNRTVEAGT